MKPIEHVFDKARRLQVPLSVHFDLTYRCHQRCVHCYIPESWRQGGGPAPELNTQEVQEVLEQLAAAGAFFLTFSGGEIFLRPDLLTILEHARKFDFSMTLMTSGTWGLEAEQVQLLADMRLEALFFSLYSLEPAIHDRVTGLAGSWDKLKQTVGHCRRRGLKVGFNVMGLSLNQHSIMAIADFVRVEDLFMRYDHLITPCWNGQPYPQGLTLDSQGSRELHKALYSFVGNEPLTVSESMEKACGAGSSGVYLTPAGDVWPCLALPWMCGNVRHEKFSRIWEISPGLLQVRQLLERSIPEEGRPCDFLRHSLTSHHGQFPGKGSRSFKQPALGPA